MCDDHRANMLQLSRDGKLDLVTMRRFMAALRKAHLNGDDTATEPMHEMSRICAKEANVIARRIAKTTGGRAQLTTPAKILRQGEFLR